MSGQHHRQSSARFIEHAHRDLAAGQLTQASEKGWDAATQILRAVAQARAWEHHEPHHLAQIASRLRAETEDGTIMLLFGAASLLRDNAAADTLSSADVAQLLHNVETLLARASATFGPAP